LQTPIRKRSFAGLWRSCGVFWRSPRPRLTPNDNRPRVYRRAQPTPLYRVKTPARKSSGAVQSPQ
jgi:hypothetical protein